MVSLKSPEGSATVCMSSRCHRLPFLNKQFELQCTGKQSKYFPGQHTRQLEQSWLFGHQHQHHYIEKEPIQNDIAMAVRLMQTSPLLEPFTTIIHRVRAC